MAVAAAKIRGALPPRHVAPLSTSRPTRTTICWSWSCVTRTPCRSYRSQNYCPALSRPSPSPRQPSPRQPSSHITSLAPSRQYSSGSKVPRGDDITMADKPEPTGTIATEGIELLTLGTPNGYKISILLEELKEAYGDKAPKVTYQTIDISKGTQKEDWFLKINPNGRIPAIVDHDRGDFPVFEGLAILSYLTKHYDPENKLSFPYESDDHSIAEQWISWQHGGIGPMQGQANHFLRAAKEKIPWGVQRYVGEAERLYGILDARLKDRDFVAGPGRGKFSIADISLLGWANVTLYGGVDTPKLFPNVAAWIKRSLERPGVQRGFAVPQPSRFGNNVIAQTLEEDAEAKKKFEELNKLVADSKAQYGYKYTSP